MGTGTFFSKVASVDPLAQALHLPGADKYVQQQASQNAGSSAANGGPYTDITPTLAGANAGYAPGGPGSNAGYTPWTPTQQGGLFGEAQRFASGAGSTIINPAGAAGSSWINPITNPVSTGVQSKG